MENRSFSPLVLAAAVLAAALVGFVAARTLGDSSPPVPVTAAPADLGAQAAQDVAGPEAIAAEGTEATIAPPDEPTTPVSTPPPAPAAAATRAPAPRVARAPRPVAAPANRDVERATAERASAQRAPSRPAPTPEPRIAEPARTPERPADVARSEPTWSRPFPAPEATVSLPDRTAPVIDAPPPPPLRRSVTLPADSVVGLRLETAVSTDTAEVEDTVHARVTRDVLVGGEIVVPAGSRVTGSVTFVDQGGKVRERARLGVRFHTLVLADGTEVRLPTETIYRDGESPAGRSAARIGGSAAAGAVLGAILGGGKGAAIGAAVGAGGGTAATMAGGRKPAVLPAGQTLTVRLSNEVDVDVTR
jgi:hypothetical protein